MFPAIRNADTVIRATELVETLLWRARLGDKAAAAEAAKGKASQFVQRILAYYDNPAIVLRTAVESGTLVSGSPPNWATGLGEYRNGGAAILQLIANHGNFDAAAQDMVRGSLHTSYGVATGTFVSASTAENTPKPVKMGTTTTKRLDAQKVTHLAVLSDEVVRHAPNVGPLISGLMRDGVLSGSDLLWTTALSTLAGTGVASVGNDAAAVLQDIDAVLETVDTNARSRLHWIVPVGVMKKLVTMTDAIGGARTFPGTTLAGGPFPGGIVKPCDHLTDTVLVADASGFVGDIGELAVDVSRSADVIMDDGPGSGAAQVVSMFQTNSHVFRAERYLGFEALRSSVVGKVTGVSWGTPGSP
jgi:hypothetical protein